MRAMDTCHTVRYTLCMHIRINVHHYYYSSEMFKLGKVRVGKGVGFREVTKLKLSFNIASLTQQCAGRRSAWGFIREAL